MIDAKWVYTWKVDEHGWVVKDKSRLVARGFKQCEGVYFSETFAPTVSSSCVRLLSAIACHCDLDFCYFDVDQAFVQSDLEDVFLRLPKGCGDLSGKVIRLNKRLYGLNQASRTWHAHLTKCLKRLGFEQCMTGVCVFRLIEDHGRVAITAVVHVDDIFAVGQKERCDRLCVDLNQTIPVKKLGDLKWYGGCRYPRDRKRGSLTKSQQSFAEEWVKKFRVTSVQSVPPEVGVKLEDFHEDEKLRVGRFLNLLVV